MDTRSQELLALSSASRVTEQKKNKRYGHELGDTVLETCDAFCGRVPKWREVARAVGYKNPYISMIGGSAPWDGLVCQRLDLADIGSHARRWNKPALGVAVVGDPRYEAASHRQRSSLVELLALLVRGLGLDPFRAIKGHDELKSGSSNPSKECPGRMLPMNPLRADVVFFCRDSTKV